MPGVKVLECVEVTDEFEPSFLRLGERVFRVKFIDHMGQITVRYVLYLPSRGFSPNKFVAELQKACIEMTEKRPQTWLQR